MPCVCLLRHDRVVELAISFLDCGLWIVDCGLFLLGLESAATSSEGRDWAWCWAAPPTGGRPPLPDATRRRPEGCCCLVLLLGAAAAWAVQKAGDVGHRYLGSHQILACTVCHSSLGWLPTPPGAQRPQAPVAFACVARLLPLRLHKFLRPLEPTTDHLSPVRRHRYHRLDSATMPDPSI